MRIDLSAFVGSSGSSGPTGQDRGADSPLDPPGRGDGGSPAPGPGPGDVPGLDDTICPTAWEELVDAYLEWAAYVHLYFTALGPLVSGAGGTPSLLPVARKLDVCAFIKQAGEYHREISLAEQRLEVRLDRYCACRHHEHYQCVASLCFSRRRKQESVSGPFASGPFDFGPIDVVGVDWRTSLVAAMQACGINVGWDVDLVRFVTRNHSVRVGGDELHFVPPSCFGGGAA